MLNTCVQLLQSWHLISLLFWKIRNIQNGGQQQTAIKSSEHKDSANYPISPILRFYEIQNLRHCEQGFFFLEFLYTSLVFAFHMQWPSAQKSTFDAWSFHSTWGTHPQQKNWFKTNVRKCHTNYTTSEVRQFSLIPQKSYKKTGLPVLQRGWWWGFHIGFDLYLQLYVLEISVISFLPGKIWHPLANLDICSSICTSAHI